MAVHLYRLKLCIPERRISCQFLRKINSTLESAATGCVTIGDHAVLWGALMKELEAKLREIIGTLSESSSPVELKLGTDLFDELGLDSMHALEIILEIEEVFGISVQDSALEHIRTLEDILKAASEAMVEG